MPYFHVSYHNAKHVQIFSDVLAEVREVLSIADPNARFSRNVFANKRYYPITPTGLCPIGFMSQVLQHVVANYPSIDLQLDQKVRHYLRPRFENLAMILPDGISELREYQIKAVQACLDKGRGIIEHPTSAGKTPVMGCLIRTLTPIVPNQIVILVPDPGLAIQTFNKFKQYGIQDLFLWVRENESDDDLQRAKVIVAHVKLINNRKADVKKLLSDASVLIVDECHCLQRGNKINNIIDQFKTPNRYGFTGTLPDSQDSQWNLIGKIGPVIAREFASDLSAQGYIADVSAISVQIEYNDLPPPVDDQLERLRTEINWLATKQFRNDVICQLAGKAPANALILVDRRAIGDALLAQLQAEYPNKHVTFVNGSVDTETREQVKLLIEQQNHVICIAMMQIYRQGIDIANLHYLILAATGKARGRLIQAIGRGRRLHKSKVKLILFDIVDMIGYSAQHGFERMRIFHEQKIPIAVKRLHETSKSYKTTD